jgi:hypothetical protein
MKSAKTVFISIGQAFLVFISVISCLNTYGANSVEYDVVELSVPGNPIDINNNGIVVIQQDAGFCIYNNGVYTFPDFKAKYGFVIPKVVKINNNNKVLGYFGNQGPRRGFMYDINTGVIEDFKLSPILYDSIAVTGISGGIPVLTFNDHEQVAIGAQTNMYLYRSGNYIDLHSRGAGSILKINNNNELIGSGVVYRNENWINLSEGTTTVTPLAINDSGIIIASRTLYNNTSNPQYDVIQINGIQKTVLYSGYSSSSAAINNISTLSFQSSKNIAIPVPGGSRGVRYVHTIVIKNGTIVYSDDIDRTIVSMNDKDQIITTVNYYNYLMTPKTGGKASVGYSNNLSNGFQFKVNGPSGFKVSIQTSTNLNQWEVMQDTTLPENGVAITDTNISMTPKRFYKAVSE